MNHHRTRAAGFSSDPPADAQQVRHGHGRADARADAARWRLLRPLPRRRRRFHSIRSRRKRPQFAGKAKRVIHLFMNGGPSHVDTFDPKPSLDEYAGKTLPMPNLQTERKTGAAFAFAVQVQEVRPERASKSAIFSRTSRKCVDDICVIRSMQADVPNHEPSLLLMNCGEARQIRPSDGLLGHLRPGQREPEPARLHRHVPRRLSDPGIAELAGGFPARRLPGHLHRHAVHRDQQADREHPEQLRHAQGATPPARSAAGSSISKHLEQRQHDGAARSAHSIVRARLPHADGCRRTPSTSAKSPSTSATCTAPARRRGRS